MALKRITIRVPAEIAAKAQRAADGGDVESVSAYFAGLAAREPDWVEARPVVDAMVAAAGGLADADVAWARSVLDGSDVADIVPPAPAAPARDWLGSMRGSAELAGDITAPSSELAD